jgi:hypothetical protein
VGPVLTGARPVEPLDRREVIGLERADAIGLLRRRQADRLEDVLAAL